jgi:L-amino acid N-acyltransferase YncA
LMEIRSARDNDAAEIASIFNYEVEHSPPIWVERFVTVEDRRKWIAARQTDGFPVLIAEDNGQVLGFGSFGPFRPYEGFRQTVEHLIYVSAAARGKGVGRALLAALIELARGQGKKVIVGAVDSENEASLILHRSMGFVETGRMPQIG